MLSSSGKRRPMKKNQLQITKNGYLKKTIYSIFAFLMLGLGISLQIKAGIGQSMLNAFALTVAELFHFQVGTLLNILNLIFFITYFVIRKTPFHYKDMIQIIATIANGYIINLFVYYLLADFVIHSYLLRVLIFLSGLLLASVSLGLILAIEIIKFPLESLCIIIGQKLGKNLTYTRKWFDVVFLCGTLLISFLSGNTLNIREGTIISFFLLSRFMGFSYQFFKKNEESVL